MPAVAERPSSKTRRRVFLVDDHPLVREWLANVINQQEDLIVCGQSEGREGCIEAMEKKRPDVAILDISLKDCSGFDLISEVKSHFPRTEVIVLSMHDSPLYARRALRAGATGYVVKRETTRKICNAIRDVLDGTQYISKEAIPPAETAPPPEDVDLSLLSDRELEIFRFLGLGNSTRQISETLGISIKTVQVHCGNIREKIGIHGATELLSAAVRWNERHGMDPD
ncbi:MAG: response regulator transcription factor [Chthoniobacteraceae bacterium]|jgi:DNA-binding NarL/FixJ family response regulator